MDLAHRAQKHVTDSSIMPGVSYCDVRAVQHSSTHLRVENGQIVHIKHASDAGIGIRMLSASRGMWKFVSVSSPESWDVVRTALEDSAHNNQRRTARAESRYEADQTAKNRKATITDAVESSDQIILYDAKPHTAKITHRTRKIPDPDAIARLGIECDNAMHDSPHITNSVVSPQYDTISKYFTSSEGADILQEYTDTITSMTATATVNGTTRSIDTTLGGMGGLEMLRDENGTAPVEKASMIAAEATKLAAADTAEHIRNADVVMDPNFVALLVHEIMGHPSEADRVMGREMAWAGGAWWKDMLGRKVASNSLNVFDDPSMPDSLGHYTYDDEGTKTARTELVKDGTLKAHMQSRETAAAYGAKPTGNMRAAGYEFMPLIRMACTCIEPGEHTRDEMISDTRDGYAIYGMRIPSIDMRRYNWSISCQYARRIRNGELAEVVRDVIVSGTAPDLFESVSACGKDFSITPITNCGKGDPMQSLVMGNGGPSVRAKATVGSISTDTAGGK